MIRDMPKRISEQEPDAILTVVAAHPGGVRVSVIREELPCELPPRPDGETGALIADGQGKGRRHRALVTGNLVAGRAIVESRGEVYVPVSPEAEAVKQAIRAPIQKRQTVGYQRAFLDAYRPNVTFYLSAETRQRLFDMGRSPDGGRPPGTYAQRIYGRLQTDLSWNSSPLERNSYSLLESGEVGEGKNALETQMILNHKAAIELLVDQADGIGFN